MGATLSERLAATIGHVADFPKPGFPFRDDVDCVVCVESFGYVFGAPLSYVLGTRTALARRAGKLPRPTFGEAYDVIYDPGRELEMHRDALQRDDRVLVVDDVLAGGGSALAAVRLVERVGGRCVGLACVAEVPLLRDMPARRELAGVVPRLCALAEI